MNGFPRQHHATLWAGIPFKSCTARQDTLKRGEHAQTCVTYHNWRHRLNRRRTGVSQYGPGDWTRRPLRPAVNPPPDGTGRVSTGPQYRATDTIWFPPALPETIGIPPPSPSRDVTPTQRANEAALDQQTEPCTGSGFIQLKGAGDWDSMLSLNRCLGLVWQLTSGEGFYKHETHTSKWCLYFYINAY